MKTPMKTDMVVTLLTIGTEIINIIINTIKGELIQGTVRKP